MATDTEKVVKDFLRAYNSGDADKAASFLTDDCVYEDVALGEVFHDKKETIGFFNLVYADVPDYKWELKSIFGAGDRVAFESVFSGTHTHSSSPDIPATGKYAAFKAATIVELRNGKINRVTDYYNLPSFLRQPGA
jgi:steroid delta-isomerase-like uncharacterized protein